MGRGLVAGAVLVLGGGDYLVGDLGDAMMVITEREREILEHALGLDRCREAYRNRYTAARGSEDLLVCVALVGKGLLVEFAASDGLVTFHVTDAGRAALTR